MGELKDLRKEKKMTQQEVADLAGISLRSYKTYENDETKSDSIKYKYLMEQLTKVKVLEQYDVNFCYLFGSYAKGKETPTSDVDLLISANIKGLKFYGLVEELRTVLHKKVDVLDMNQLKENLELTEEILKDGVKIYG